MFFSALVIQTSALSSPVTQTGAFLSRWQTSTLSAHVTQTGALSATVTQMCTPSSSLKGMTWTRPSPQTEIETTENKLPVTQTGAHSAPVTETSALSTKGQQ